MTGQSHKVTLILQDVGASETWRNGARWKNPGRHLAERLRSVANQVDQAETKWSGRLLQRPPGLAVFRVIAILWLLCLSVDTFISCARLRYAWHQLSLPNMPYWIANPLSLNLSFHYNCCQWRRQLWGTGAHAHPSTSNNFIFSSLWSKSESQLSKYCVVCEISWRKCQQLTALSISTPLVTKLLVTEQLLHPALKSTVSAPWQNSASLPLVATNPGDATDCCTSRRLLLLKTGMCLYCCRF